MAGAAGSGVSVRLDYRPAAHALALVYAGFVAAFVISKPQLLASTLV
jgi:glucose-6-phosphate dehydrogenase assembly protein OpcA